MAPIVDNRRMVLRSTLRTAAAETSRQQQQCQTGPGTHTPTGPSTHRQPLAYSLTQALRTGRALRTGNITGLFPRHAPLQQ